MTQIKQEQINRFRKAFPEFSHYSDAEAMAFCRNFKREKKQADRFIEGRVKYYEKKGARAWAKKRNTKARNSEITDVRDTE